MNPASWKIRTAHDLIPGLNLEYSFGSRPGDSTGWPSLDGLLTIEPGYLTTITGWPGSGKSEWLDALMVNLVRDLGWKFAIFSPENQPMPRHVAKMVEKVLHKPFAAGPTPRATWEEVQEAAALLRDNMLFLSAGQDDTPTPDDLIAVFTRCVERLREDGESHKVGVVIDPWNELDHMRPPQLSETEYISRVLTRVRNWAREFWVAVFIVAHPAKQRREEGKLPICRPDMISGSQHWWNKSDMCVTIHRDYENDNGEIDVHVQKVRFKNIGKPGVATLRYDRVTGCYSALPRDQHGREYTTSFSRAA